MMFFKQLIHCKRLQAISSLGLCIFVFGFADLFSVASANAFQANKKAPMNDAGKKDGKSDEAEEAPKIPEEPFVPDFVDDDFVGSEARAW